MVYILAFFFMPPTPGQIYGCFILCWATFFTILCPTTSGYIRCVCSVAIISFPHTKMSLSGSIYFRRSSLFLRARRSHYYYICRARSTPKHTMWGKRRGNRNIYLYFSVCFSCHCVCARVCAFLWAHHVFATKSKRIFSIIFTNCLSICLTAVKQHSPAEQPLSANNKQKKNNTTRAW